MFGPGKFFDWLLLRVRDGGAGALQELADFARNEDEMFAQRPAAAAMLCWGEAGCKAIAKNAIENPTVKNLSAAFQLLSIAASMTEGVSPRLIFIANDELLTAIDRAISKGQLRQPARESLMDVFQSLDTEDLLIPLGTSFSQLAFVAGAGSSELVRAMSSRWVRIGPSTLQTYGSLIRSDPGDEPKFQRFFSEHPQFLDPMALQVWSQPDFHGAHQPDFLIRRADNTYLVVEIETPSKQLITGGGQLSAEATHAEKQATDYRTFLDERRLEVRRHFAHYGGAECLVVIGLDSGLSEAQSKALATANAARHNVRIASFDWLGRRAAAIFENISSGEVDVIKKYRVI